MWLDEIDVKYGVDSPVPTAYSADYGDLTCIRRMARALREVVRGLKLHDIRVTCSLDVVFLDTKEAHQNLRIVDAKLALWDDNLSDDAKELVEEADKS